MNFGSIFSARWMTELVELASPLLLPLLQPVQTSRAKNNDNSAIADSTDTFIGFSADKDDGGYFVNLGSANSTTYTSTTYYNVFLAGWYSISTQLYSADADIDANEAIQVKIYINGVQTRATNSTEKGTVASPNDTRPLNDSIYLNKNDKISVCIRHTAGADIGLSNSDNFSWFTVSRKLR